MSAPNECRKLRAEGACRGKQCFSYVEGIARATVGSQGICLHLLRGGRARAPDHPTPRTEIRAIQRPAEMCWGDRLGMGTLASNLVYFPAEGSHLPVTRGTEEAVAGIARRVAPSPALEALVAG